MNNSYPSQIVFNPYAAINPRHLSSLALCWEGNRLSGCNNFTPNAKINAYSSSVFHGQSGPGVRSIPMATYHQQQLLPPQQQLIPGVPTPPQQQLIPGVPTPPQQQLIPGVPTPPQQQLIPGVPPPFMGLGSGQICGTYPGQICEQGLECRELVGLEGAGASRVCSLPLKAETSQGAVAMNTGAFTQQLIPGVPPQQQHHYQGF
jgi:hypothetical protein